MEQNEIIIKLDLSTIGLSELIDQRVNIKISELSSTATEHSPQETNLSREEAADYLKISLPTLHQKTKTGEIKAHRLGSRVIYKRSDLDLALKPIKLPKF